MNTEGMLDKQLRQRARACREDIENACKMSVEEREFQVEKAWLAIAAKPARRFPSWVTFGGGVLSAALALWLFSLVPAQSVTAPKPETDARWSVEFAAYLNAELQEEGDYDAAVVPGFGTIDFDSVEYEETSDQDEWGYLYEDIDDNFAA